jgi:hypothetical protein
MVMRRSRLVSIIVGAATTLLFLFLVLVFGSRFFPNPMPEGVLLAGPAHYLRVATSVLVSLTCVVSVCFIGGYVAGWLSSGSPGINGALCTGLAFFGGFAWFIWSLVPWVFVEPSNPGEVFTRSDNVGALMFLSTAFCVALPFVALAGLLGGRLGERHA